MDQETQNRGSGGHTGNGALTKEEEAEARKRTLSNATIPTLKINGDFAR